METKEMKTSFWPSVVGDWYEPFRDLWESPKMKLLQSDIKAERKNVVVYPKGEDTFKAFRACKYEEFKVLFLGQDPYMFENQANGLAFDCSQSQFHTPSFIKIYEQHEREIGNVWPTHMLDGDLSYWAEQGVLLLNSALTVRHKEPGSHFDLWKGFTRGFLNRALSDTDTPGDLFTQRFHKPVVVVTFGNVARQMLPDNIKGHVHLHAVHPAYSSRQKEPWRPLGGKFFGTINEKLMELGYEDIDW